MKKSFQKIMVN